MAWRSVPSSGSKLAKLARPKWNIRGKVGRVDAVVVPLKLTSIVPRPQKWRPACRLPPTLLCSGMVFPAELRQPPASSWHTPSGCALTSRRPPLRAEPSPLDSVTSQQMEKCKGQPHKADASGLIWTVTEAAPLP